MSCAILSCENSKINCRSFAISLFSIPKNENIKQIWLRNARLENLSEKQKSKVFLCEKHFERKLINFSQFTTRLAIGSVPIPIIESPEEGVNNQHFCRICESKEELINLEQSKNVKIVIEMLTTIANVTFSLDDQLPHMICQKCKEKVVLSFEFKYQIEATDRKLRQLLLKESSKIDVAEAAVEESISSNACDTNIESKPPNVDMNETTKDHKPMMKVVVLLPGNTMKNDGHTIKYPSINRIYFECYICKKSFKTRKPLWAHQMRSHMATDKRNVSTNKCCSVCSKEFSDLNNLERHIRDVHEQLKTYKCNMCDKLYAQKATCVSHEMTHNADLSVRCTICDKLLKNPKNLRLHHRHIHEGQKRVRQKLHKTYRACEYCGKRIRTPNYRLHLRVHTGEKPYKCNYCDKFFSTITGRTYHSRIHTGEKPYKCNVCNKLFTRINSMVLHSRTHTDEKPYKCTMCDKKFRQLPHLSVHMSIHTGEKNHKCDTCGKAFAHRATLICHIRQHTGETPYQCTVCSKKFFDLNGLKRHRKVHQ